MTMIAVEENRDIIATQIWYHRGWNNAFNVPVTNEIPRGFEYKEFLSYFHLKDSDENLGRWLNFMEGWEEYFQVYNASRITVQ